MLSDEKFCDAAMKFALLANVEDKKFTLDEYKELIAANQTDKDGNLVYLYATDKTAQYSYIKAAKDKGYDVLLINDQLGNHFVGLLEHKLEKSRFVRVDSDIVENLIVKEERKVSAMTPAERNIFSELFRCQIPHVDKTEFLVSFESLGSESQPVQITQSEYMRRMKEMAAMQPGMSFYGEMPDSYNLVLNTEHPVVKRLLDEAKASLNEKCRQLKRLLTSRTKRHRHSAKRKMPLTTRRSRQQSMRQKPNLCATKKMPTSRHMPTRSLPSAK